MNKTVLSILTAIAVISVLFTLVGKTPVPPGFNADEAAFGYNAYSLLKTGRDEYGTLLPLRLKSFGDYKMPLYSYLSIPFIAVLGLNETGTRALNVFLSFLFPFAVYLLTVKLFGKKRIGIAAALLSSVSLGLHVVARHAHEAYLAAFLTTIASYLFLKSLESPKARNIAAFLAADVLMLFSYHPGRLFSFMFLGYAVLHVMFQKKKQVALPLAILITTVLFGLTDLAYNPQRLKTLAFFNNEGFNLKITELKTEGGVRYLYNPVLIGIKDILQDHFTYFSPQFLISNGDENYRFGYPGMSILTPIEYLLFLIGLYYAFKQKEKWRHFLVTLLLCSPLSASLAWSKGSLTRTLFLLIPVMITAAYGGANMLTDIKKRYRAGAVVFGALLFGLFLVFSWDFYLFHYPKRLITIHAWQAGYAEVNGFIKDNYNRFDTFYITKDIGQPYIFTLFYLNYPPFRYQKEALLSGADEYGFGQVDRFDKFVFEFTPPEKLKGRYAVIGSVDNFKGLGLDENQLKTVAVNGEPMFRIYESP